MHPELERFLRREFAVVQGRAGSARPCSFLIERNLARDCIEIRIEFAAQLPPMSAAVFESEVVEPITYVERPPPIFIRIPWELMFSRQLPTEHELEALWWRVHEDGVVDRELREFREHIRAMEEAGLRPDAIQDAWRRFYELREHARRHHHVRDYGAVGDRFTDDSAAIQAAINHAGPGDTVSFGSGTYYIGSELDFGAFAREINGGWSRASDPQAAERGWALLVESLSAEQQKMLKKKYYFEVIGSASGKTYRIRKGRQQNVYELNKRGEEAQGWCFLPSGGLCEGDCMLAQKIALETDEAAALKVAHKFGCYNVRPGAVNYIDGPTVGPAMTATEVHELQREAYRRFGERATDNMFGGVVDRLLGLVRREGR